MGSFIQELIRNNEVAAYVDGRFGHWNDLSGSGNDGVMSAGSLWSGFGMCFPTNADEVTIADDLTMRLATGSIVAVLDVQSMTATEYVVAHDNAGSGYSLGINATSLVFTGDGVARTIVTSLYGAKSIGATFVHGGTPIGYVEGLSVGNFSGVVNVTAAAIATEIGNWANSGRCKSIIKAALVCNRILDAAEMAKAHEELVDMAYPTSTWGFAKNEQDVFKRDPQLISGWNLKPTGGQVADEITTRDLTTINQMVHKPGILGEGMSGDVAGYLATANQVYANADFSTNGMSIEAWVRPGSVAAGTEYILSIHGRVRIRRNGSILQWQVYDSGAVWQQAQSAAAALRANELIHVIGTAEANGAVRLYINEVLQPTVDTMANFNMDVAGRPTTWGVEWNFSAGQDADFFKPRIYDHELSQEEVSAKYLAGAQAIQFLTDFGFQVSPAAEGGVLGQVIGTRSSPFRAGDAVGRWKIETDTIDGQLCKVLTCTTAGIVYIPGHLFFDTTPTEAAFGTFSGWMYKANASTLTWKFAGTDLNPAANGYALVWAADESVVVSELGVGNIIAGGSASHSTWHQFDVTRASDGDFDGYIDETTFGNGNDLTITASIGMLWDMDAGDKIALNPSGIIKRLGVFPP